MNLIALQNFDIMAKDFKAPLVLKLLLACMAIILVYMFGFIIGVVWDFILGNILGLYEGKFLQSGLGYLTGGLALIVVVWKWKKIFNS